MTDTHLNTSEAAKRLNLPNTATVRELIKAGKLPNAVQDKSNRWHIPIADIDAFLSNQTQSSTPTLTRMERIKSPLKQLGVVRIATILLFFFALISAVADFEGARQLISKLIPNQPFPEANDNETLIVIAAFHRSEGVIEVEANNEIRHAIQQNIDTLKLDNVRVEIDPTALRSEERDLAESLGKEHNASLIIWGSNTGVHLKVNFLNLKEPDFDSAEIKISETVKTQIANPEDYNQFIVDELPRQISFLSFFALGQIKYSQADYEGSLELIETAVNSLNNLPEVNNDLGLDNAYFRLGWLYQNDGQMVQAITNYDLALNLDPEIDAALNNRGVAYYYLEDYEQAIENYNQVIDLDSKNADAFNNRGIAYTLQEEYEKALVDYNQALILKPENVETLNNRGIAYHDMEEFELAIDDFNQAILLNSSLVEALVNRGNVYIELEVVPLEMMDKSNRLTSS